MIEYDMHLAINERFKSRLRHAWRNKYLYLTISVLLAILGFIYLRYTNPRYHIETTLLLAEEQRGALSTHPILSDLVPMEISSSTIENELEILKSRSLREKIITDLQLNIRYFATGRVKSGELFSLSPYQITLLPSKAIQKDIFTLYITGLSTQQFRIQIGDSSFLHTWKDTLSLPVGKIVVKPIPNVHLDDPTIQVQIEPMLTTFMRYQNYLKVIPVQKFSNIVRISCTDPLPDRGERILKQLITDYTQLKYDERTNTTNLTEDFIESHLGEVQKELNLLEEHIQEFRQSHQSIHQEKQGTLLLEEHQSQLQNTASLSLKQESLQRLQQSLMMQEPLVTSEWITLPHLQLLLTQYNEQLAHYHELQKQYASQHPTLQATERILDTYKTTIKHQVDYLLKDNNQQLGALKKETSTTRYALSKLPETERLQQNLVRKREIQQEIYLYLLRKQMEVGLLQASIPTGITIIDAPKASTNPQYPNKQLVVVTVLLLSLFLPTLILFLKQGWTPTIETIQDVRTLFPQYKVRNGSIKLPIHSHTLPTTSLLSIATRAPDHYKSIHTAVFQIRNWQEQLEFIPSAPPDTIFYWEVAPFSTRIKDLIHLQQLITEYPRNEHLFIYSSQN